MNNRWHSKFLTGLVINLAMIFLFLDPARAATRNNAQPMERYSSSTFTNCVTQTEIPEAECHALIALYNSTNGASWSNHTGWLQTDTPCSWFGIVCANGSNVTEINLDAYNLVGTIPPELGNLSHLAVLYFGEPAAIPEVPYFRESAAIRFNSKVHYFAHMHALEMAPNHLSGPIPPELGNLINLRILALGANQLSGPIPSQLGNLTNLQILVLEGNRLNGIIPPALGKLTNLEELFLRSTQLSGLIPPELGNLTHLRIVALSDNQLSGALPPELGSLTGLSLLILNDNQLSGVIPFELGNLKYLRSFYLHGNHLSGDFPPSITNLISLDTFTFDCWITSTDPSVISFIDSLSPGWQNNICPVVLSITSGDSNPSKGPYVKFTAIFSEPVTGVDANDFSLQATSDLTGASLMSVRGAGTTYVVTVNTGTYNDSRIGLIDINTATLAQLDTLPGIGPTLAQRIVDYRALNWPFLRTEEMMNIPGIGPATFQNIRDLITVYGPFLQLDVADDDSIKNGNNILLGGAGIGNGNYTSGEFYTIIGISGADTVGVFRPSNGALYLKNKNVTGFADVQINYGLGGDYPVVGDWDGNGTVTIGIYRNGSFYLRNENTIGFADIVFPFGLPGDQPIAGDWNGDGKDTIGVYRNGTFFLRNENSAGASQISFARGIPGDVGIAGDWNGDGLDTTGVFRPSNGALYLKNQNTTGFADIQINYGIAGDKPVTGDWDNDGKDTIGVYRNGTFYLRNENTIGFADIVFDLGIRGDIPIAGNWDGIP